GKRIRLLTRNEKNRTSHYPDLAAAILREETTALIADGEIVAFAGEETWFSKFQNRMQNARPSCSNEAAVPGYFKLLDLNWLYGYNEGGELRFGGKVGTGFNERELDRLSAKLRRLERQTSPLADTKGIAMKGVHWVRPELVAEVGFAEWTPDGKLRHPRYLGL